MMLWLLACTPTPTLEQQRAALQAYEQAQISERFSNEGRFDAVAATESCLQADAIDHNQRSTFCEQARALRERATPLESMELHSLLYEAAPDGRTRSVHRSAALQAAFEHRYQAEQQRSTRAAQAGVTLKMALRATDTLRREYVRSLDDASLLTAAKLRLVRLTKKVLDHSLQPRLPDGPFSVGFSSLVEQGVKAGLPEEMVAAELTQAVFERADPHSTPIWPTAVRSWDEHHQGSHPGRIGVYFDRRGDSVPVLGLHPAGPAYRAGIHIHDHILQVGQLDVVELLKRDAAATEAIAAALAGPNGEVVEVQIHRAGTPHRFLIPRATLTDQTVHGYRWRPGVDDVSTPKAGIALVRIGGFRPHTPKEFDALLPQLSAFSSIVLDLRGNSGGDLDAALAIADHFIQTGPIVKITGRVVPPLPEGWGVASAGGALEHHQVAVLVDQGTASSAEVLAGALQQHGAIVVGSRTTGKGSSQVLRVDDELGFALQFTNLYWTLADGTVIRREPHKKTWGIQPDLPEVLTPTERYVVGVLQAQREAPTQHQDGSPMPYTGPTLGPKVPPLSADPQLQRAYAALSS